MSTLPARDLALDAFRGLTVILMVLVNVQGSGADAYPWLVHAPWHGLTLADLVFPWFLLIVGLAIPLVIDARPTPIARILRRAALLFALGLALAWLIRPETDPAMIRWMGVLQRIGIVYLACALVARAGRGVAWPALAALAALIVHTLLLFAPAPGGAAGLEPGEGLAGWLDRALLPGRLFRETWDPEGALSTLPAIASGLFGVATMRWLRSSPPRPNARLAALALVLTAAGGALAAIVPVNKALWTASFTLLTGGLGLGLWAALRAAWPAMGRSQVIRPFVFAGQTALTLYVVHMLLISLLVRRWPGDQRLWDSGYAAVRDVGLAPPAASLAFALVATMVSLAIVVPLRRRGWLIRL